MKRGLREKAIRGVAWTAFGDVASQLSSFVVFVILARLLEPTDFGLVAIADVSVAFFGLFINQGMSSAIVQRHELDREHLDTAFWLNLFVGLLVVGLVVALADWIAGLYKQPEIKGIILLLSIGLLCTSLNQVQIALLRRKLAFKSIAIRSLVAEPIGGAIGVTMALMGFGVWSLVWREIIVAVVRLLILWSASDWRPGLSFSWRHLRDLYSFGLSMTAASFLNFANKRLDNMFIGYFLGATMLGYYNLAKRLIQLTSELLVGTINKVAWPVFSRIQLDHAKLKRVLFEATKLSTLAAFPVFMGFAVLAPDLVLLLFGDKWDVSVPVVQVLAILGAVRSVVRFQESLIVGVGKSNWRLGLQLVLSVANVLAFFVAMRWGLVAVATAYVVVALFLAPLWTAAVRRLVKLDLPEYLDTFRWPLFATLIMGGAVKMFLLVPPDEPSALRISVAVLLGVLTYSLAIRIGDPDTFTKMRGYLRDFTRFGR